MTRYMPGTRNTPTSNERRQDTGQMKYEVRVGADTRSVSIERNAQGELRVALELPAPDVAGAKDAAVDILEIGPGSFSILFQGASFDTQIIPEAEGLAVFCRGREFHATVRDPRA